MGVNDDVRHTMELIAAGRTSNLTCPFCQKDKLKKVYTYGELQKTAPDRKNLIHVLVRF